jgi:hypothetical protein
MNLTYVYWNFVNGLKNNKMVNTIKSEIHFYFYIISIKSYLKQLFIFKNEFDLLFWNFLMG